MYLCDDVLKEIPGSGISTFTHELLVEKRSMNTLLASVEFLLVLLGSCLWVSEKVESTAEMIGDNSEAGSLLDAPQECVMDTFWKQSIRPEPELQTCVMKARVCAIPTVCVQVYLWIELAADGAKVCDF